MSNPNDPRLALDESKRQVVIALITNGSSRRVAARYVGCAPATITRTAVRDPAFAEQLAHAEHRAEIHLLRAVQAAADDPKYWRAAAWLLERRNPEDFAPRPPQVFTAEQVRDLMKQVTELLRADVPEENCRRAAAKVDEWISEFKIADSPVLFAEKGAEDTGAAPQPETAADPPCSAVQAEAVQDGTNNRADPTEPRTPRVAVVDEVEQSQDGHANPPDPIGPGTPRVAVAREAEQLQDGRETLAARVGGFWGPNDRRKCYPEAELGRGPEM